MKPALAFRQPHFPKAWEKLPNGELILKQINSVMSSWWPKFFGYHLLKIGSLSGYIDTKSCSIKHQVTLTENKSAVNNIDGALYAEIDDLPILEHSVDVVILSHALEFSLDPHHIVREANRVLIPNGYLVITGYNALSLSGLNQFIPYRRQQSPWNERFFSAMRIKDWLQLMGYEVLMDERGLHSSLANQLSQNIIAKNWRVFAQNYLPSLGSLYVIVAKKRVLPLTPIKPKWKLRPELKPVNVSSIKSSLNSSLNSSKNKI